MNGPLDAEERARVTEWFNSAFATEAGAAGAVPFSFCYGDQPVAEALAEWRRIVAEDVGDGADRRTVTYADPATGLEVRCEARLFREFPAVEWVLHFRNSGPADTPIIADIEALDAAFALPRDRGCRVLHARGSECAVNDFEPLRDTLNPDGAYPQAAWVGAGNPLTVATHGGRSSCGALPFFDLQMDGPGAPGVPGATGGTRDALGVIGAIGWTGDWAARFWRGDGGEVHAQAGMQRTHLLLHPREEIRSPRILLLFWNGDPMRGHNLLRRLILAHYTPRPDAELLRAPVSLAVWGENRAERQIAKISWLLDNEIAIDNFWIDAGWHGEGECKDSSNVFNSAWGSYVGDWWPKKSAYPEGLRPIGDLLRGVDMRFTLWFEPERVFRGTFFTREEPGWLLGPLGDNSLFDLGDPVARAGLTDLISSVIDEGRITVYRQDFNMDPAPFWHAADAPDRVGMAEIRHIEGLYAFWDELLRRHPDLIIDNCSSGGRRIDLETISRSIPLWRSDYQCFPNFDPIGLQGQTQGLAVWVPLSTGCCDHPETYAFRSALGPGMVLATAANPKAEPEGYFTPWEVFPAEWLRKAVEEQKLVQPFFYGDFYPLLSFSLAEDAWAAWQFDRPDLGQGVIIALRRQRSPYAEIVARPRGLEVDATYEIEDLDSGVTRRVSGRELVEEGFAVRIADQPGSRLLLYSRVADQG